MVSPYSVAARYVPAQVKMLVRSFAGCTDDPYEIETEMCRFHGQLAVDVGANDGHTTRLLAMNFQRVVAFEPHPVSFAKLHKSAWQYEGRVKVDHRAVGSASDETTVFESRLSRRVGMYFRPEMRNHWGKAEKLKRAKTVSLDDYFSGKELFWDQKPDFVKIDVEGAEVEVLTGMRGIIRDKRPALFVEVHSRSNGRLISEAFDATYSWRELRHPSLRRNSEDWKDHYWLVGTPY